MNYKTFKLDRDLQTLLQSQERAYFEKARNREGKLSPKEVHIHRTWVNDVIWAFSDRMCLTIPQGIQQLQSLHADAAKRMYFRAAEKLPAHVVNVAGVRIANPERSNLLHNADISNDMWFKNARHAFADAISQRHPLKLVSNNAYERKERVSSIGETGLGSAATAILKGYSETSKEHVG